jgi:hypothetical protein
MGLAVHEEAAAAADAFAAVVLHRHRPLARCDQLLIELIQRLQQRQIGRHRLQGVVAEAARSLG